MTSVDLVMVVMYLLLMIYIGYRAGRENNTNMDYFFASRNMPWIPVALSIAATMISANGFIGGPGWGYTEGMYPFMVNITVPLAIFFAIFVTTPILYYLKVTSIYEYMEKRLGLKSRFLAIAQFYINGLIQVSSMVYISVLLVHSMTGWNIQILVPIIVTITILYTIIGGIKAVIWTDTIQMVVVIGGVFLAIYIAIDGIGLSLGDTLAMAKSTGKLDTLNFSTDLTITNTFIATLIGGVFMWIRYFSFDQTQVQRVLTSKSLNSAKNSFVVGAFVMSIVYYLMLFIGVLLFIFYDRKTFETSNEIMITFILNEMPIGIVGLFIAGILAAAMSSIDSVLNSMTAVFTKDIYERHISKNGKQASLKTSMIFTFIIGMIISVFILLVFNGTTKSILDVVGTYVSYFAGPAVGSFLLAMFYCKANDHGVSIGFISGLILGFIISYVYSPSWLLNPFIGASITIIAGVMFSAIFKVQTGDNTLTVFGIRRKMLIENVEIDKPHLPFTFGRQEITVLSLFIGQYVILLLIQYF